MGDPNTACEHGRQRRKCEVCELEDNAKDLRRIRSDNATLRRELAKVDEAVDTILNHTNNHEFTDEDKADKNMERSDWFICLSNSYGALRTRAEEAERAVVFWRSTYAEIKNLVVREIDGEDYAGNVKQTLFCYACDTADDNHSTDCPLWDGYGPDLASTEPGDGEEG